MRQVKPQLIVQPLGMHPPPVELSHPRPLFLVTTLLPITAAAAAATVVYTLRQY